MTKPKPDIRPRFGWCNTIDNDPQVVWEKRDLERTAMANRPKRAPVVVIPLPYMSAKIRHKIKAFLAEGTIWP